MNALRINRSLAEISKNVHNLRIGTLGDNIDLLSIMRTTKALQVELTSDKILSGFRTDAITQLLRVHELIEEAGPSPDHKALLSIGMAAELAVKKLNDYREMHTFRTQTKSKGHGLDQLAA
ncbi:hypothetical protein Despr_2459 [Desulfobulbus propionicus DSM 2032]|uniref:Uncharacterized protein n=1 Tax=Desulfobulbus propionicus (strain ATCC 33891 / DSM 2032 / VKM B-1956 / 1pr3) TaxID=577650 RepID=A0A7U3YNF3_DESPD|nr:hypothetical protein [Desulfobulbus propionicus]ADW18598.1 hypothetical protein Despr_2459 [Desulfobulbus propionicus DSM 2032]